ncbi:hypothetical protein KR038_001052, partial [Drosophila bunnanda]
TGPTVLDLTVRDQVDNNTNTTQLFKNNYNNIMNDLNREEVRVKTFNNWPLEWLDKNELALTGMFFTNFDDKVKCYFCGVEIGRWEQEDQPVPEHLRWSPNCPLLRRRTTNNVPLSWEELDRVLPPISYDICGANDSSSAVELREHAYAEGRIPLSHIQSTTGVNPMVPSMPSTLRADATSMASAATQANGDVQPETCRAPAASGTYFPEYPEFAVESARRRTFDAWPRNLKQKPHQLAEAGFFYTGVGDRVRCFSCGGGLKDWDDNDEPWEEHARWLSQCRFVKLMKGQVYIDTVSVKPIPVEEKEADVGPLAEEAVTTATSRSTTSAEEELSSSAASSSGDVAPSAPSAAKTATTRIFEKNAESTAASSAPAASNGSTIPEEKLCKICYGAEYNTAFLPCGHVVACAKCASSVTKCPLCRKPFTDVMRVYFS